MGCHSKNFTSNELACTHCGVNNVDSVALEKLQLIRDLYQKPMNITSAYRCKDHSIEAKKSRPGKHNEGIAFDVLAQDGSSKFELIRIALEVGASGIGIHKDFVHLDFRETTPVVWLY